MVVFWSPLTTFSPGRRARPSATSGVSPGTYQTIEQHGALYCPNIPRKNDWTNPAHSPSTECLAWTFREEPSPECRLLDSDEKSCTSSYSPSLVDPQDCGQGGETTTTPATEITTTPVPTTTVTTTTVTTTTTTTLPTTTSQTVQTGNTQDQITP